MDALSELPSQRVRPAAVSVAAGVLIAAVYIVYAPVLLKLATDWRDDDNYSHGFLILPMAAYIVWERLPQWKAREVRPSAAGLVILLAGVLMYVAGMLGAELFITRTSLIVVLAGVVVWMFGWGHLRLAAFPLAFLILMIPIPRIIFNEIAFPLQLLASRFGQSALELLQIPVLRQGNVMVLAHTTLEVAEACSGIRSLVSLLTLSIVYAHWTEPRLLLRTLLVVTTVPIAILTNGMRVAAIGVAAHFQGVDAVNGPFHTASGWMVFVLAFALVFLLHRVIRVFIPSEEARRDELAVV